MGIGESASAFPPQTLALRENSPTVSDTLQEKKDQCVSALVSASNLIVHMKSA